jgi:hypothetical protein
MSIQIACDIVEDFLLLDDDKLSPRMCLALRTVVEFARRMGDMDALLALANVDVYDGATEFDAGAICALNRIADAAQ